MPGILITFVLLLLSVIVVWFKRRLGMFVFIVFLIVFALVFLHHATDHLQIYL